MLVIEWALFFLCWLSLLEALHSLRGGFSFRRFLRRQAHQEPPSSPPPTTLIVPCRGLDPGFRSNLEAFFRQDHPDYQLILVCDSGQDPCLPVLRELRMTYAAPPSRLLISGPAQGRSQKVHNQLAALRHLRRRDTAIAFGDSDIRPGQDWLRFLLAPLTREDCAASTGFRWYLPQRGGWASLLRSVWNAGSLSLLSESGSPFAWGGAMAMQRTQFDRLEIAPRWENALSDDYVLSNAVRGDAARSGRGICFQPHAISLSLEDCTWKELLEFTFRQMVITRVYHPALWKLALLGQSLNTLSLWGSAVVLGVIALAGWPLPSFGPVWAAVLAAIYLLGVWKASLRLQGLDALVSSAVRRSRWAYLLLGPAAALLTLQALLRSALTNKISWRGIVYRLHAADHIERLS